MAGFLDDTVAAVAAGGTIRMAALLHFDFVGDPRWYWMGAGPLRTADGQMWEGTGGLGMISGLDSAIGTSAPVATFAMSGVDARVAAVARSQSASVKGREVTVFLQFYTPDLTLLDAPVQVWWGLLDLMSYKGDGQGKYIVSCTAESVWAGRNRSPFGFLTDSDQKARYPGDRGLEQVGSLPSKTVYWPS